MWLQCSSRKQNTKLRFRLHFLIWIHLWGYRCVPTGSPKNNCYLPKNVQVCFQPGSNRRPCACEAHVITTTLWKPSCFRDFSSLSASYIHIKICYLLKSIPLTFCLYFYQNVVEKSVSQCKWFGTKYPVCSLAQQYSIAIAFQKGSLL